MKQPTEQITAKIAAERLNMDRTNVLRALKRGELNGRYVTEAPRPYWVIFVDETFLAEEILRNKKALDQSQN